MEQRLPLVDQLNKIFEKTQNNPAESIDLAINTFSEEYVNLKFKALKAVVILIKNDPEFSDLTPFEQITIASNIV